MGSGDKAVCRPSAGVKGAHTQMSRLPIVSFRTTTVPDHPGLDLARALTREVTVQPLTPSFPLSAERRGGWGERWAAPSTRPNPSFPLSARRRGGGAERLPRAFEPTPDQFRDALGNS